MARWHAALLLLAAGFGGLGPTPVARAADGPWSTDEVAAIQRKREEWLRNTFLCPAVGAGGIFLGWAVYSLASTRSRRRLSAARRLFDPDDPLLDDPSAQ